jgi:hypothetical protein
LKFPNSDFGDKKCADGSVFTIEKSFEQTIGLRLCGMMQAGELVNVSVDPSEACVTA